MNAILVPLLASLGPMALALLAAVAFAETGIMAGFFLPGDSILFAAGVLVAAGVIQLPLALVIATVALAAFVGDQVGYLVGRRWGPRLLNRPDSRWLSPRHLESAGQFFDRHGPRAVILARFVPLARTFTPVVAGAAAMPRRHFLAYNLVGAVAWSAVMLVAGALLGGIPFVAGHIELITIGLVTLSLLPALIGLARSRRRPHDPLESPQREEPITRTAPRAA